MQILRIKLSNMDILIIMEAKDYGYEEDDGGGGDVEFISKLTF